MMKTGVLPKAALVIVALVTILLLMAGCTGGDPEDEEDNGFPPPDQPDPPDEDDDDGFAPPDPPDPPSSCSFEDPKQGGQYCGLWRDAADDEFDWSRWTGRTPSSITGPTSAAEGSWYLYTETNSPRNESDRAILRTTFNFKAEWTMHFKYHMYGSDMVRLQLKVDETAVWNMSGNQGNMWRDGVVHIPCHSMGIVTTIAFMGIRGSDWKGEMAIDDVNFVSGKACTAAITATTTSTTTTTTSTTMTTTTITTTTITITATTTPTTTTPTTTSTTTTITTTTTTTTTTATTITTSTTTTTTHTTTTTTTTATTTTTTTTTSTITTTTTSTSTSTTTATTTTSTTTTTTTTTATSTSTSTITTTTTSASTSTTTTTAATTTTQTTTTQTTTTTTRTTTTITTSTTTATTTTSTTTATTTTTDKCHKAKQAPFGAKCEQTATVTGGFTMSVSNAHAFVSDPQAKYGVRKAIAGLANVPVSAVAVTLKLVLRRLESFSQPRLLSATGTVAASYTIATGGAVSATDVQTSLASVKPSELKAAISAQVNSTSYTTNILSITQPTITGGTPRARSAVPGAYDGVWKGPPEKGASGFEGVEIGIVAACTAVVALISGALAAWKHMLVENAMEKSFEVTGKMTGRWPMTVAAITIILGIAISGGMAAQKAEADPAKLWVPVGSVSLDHSEYVKDNWPSSANPTLLTISPKDSAPGKNILTAENLQSMLHIHHKILSIHVDGSKVVEDSKGIADYTARYGGLWTFDGRGGTRKKCVQWGPTCAMQSVLAIFDYNPTLIIDEVGIIDRIAKWDAAPLNTIVPGLGLYKGFESTDVLGGVMRDGSGRIIGAEVFSWNMFQQQDRQEVVIKYGNEADTLIADPITLAWEADAACILGVTNEHPSKKGTSCQQPDGNLEYSSLFTRSFADEFGTAIRSDGVGAAYSIVFIYLFINLGKRDTVHSMMAMSLGCLACVGLSYAGGMGLGALFGVKTNPLNNNIPFLILGLGVDGAFVLVAELTRHITNDKKRTPVVDIIALTAKTGGASVLITSLTGALAFLVGASTAPPALSAFCVYAGIVVILCFLFQIFLFLPLLALNLHRTRAKKYDLFCCFSAQEEHEIDKPKGCCCCICYPGANPRDALLPRIFGEVGKITVKSIPGKVGTIFVWIVIFAVGIAGVTQVKQDFKLEWFSPDGSYTRKFIDLNDHYFSQGTTFNIYTDDVDLFTSQAAMNELTSYVAQKSVVKQDTVQNWWADFRPRPTVSPASTMPSAFYRELWTWFGTSDFKNSIQWVDAKCNSKDNAVSATCDPTKGVARTCISATLARLGGGAARFQTVNQMRLEINKIFDDDSGMKAFPFSNDFVYWEENSIIATEFARNLIIAAGVVFIIICVLIPRPRIACVVLLGICMSIVELLGFMHWWGITVNGTSTIYLLICLGLSVNYSAHIAHIFKESYGSTEDRAIKAMTRVGPSVFHALFSTILAVIFLAVSNTYFFEVFFKVLFLATMITGFKGLWLLPTVLSMVGHHERYGRSFTMYHGTTFGNATRIERYGFEPSSDGMLGPGVYASRDFKKAEHYGQVVFKLIVYVGKVKRIDHQGHPMQKTWSSHGYDTAWVPPGCGMVDSNLEEDCIHDPKRIRIVKRVRG